MAAILVLGYRYFNHQYFVNLQQVQWGSWNTNIVSQSCFVLLAQSVQL